LSSSLQKGKSFEEEVAALFKLMGYSTEINTLINAGQIDIRVEIKLGLVTQKGIIECKNYSGTNVGIEDVEKFCNRISLARQKDQTDFGMLISNTDFSAQAKLCATSYGFVQLRTYRQLLSQLIDFEAYLKNFVYDFEHYDEYSNG
jgi:Restriction endonuclease